MVYTGSTTLHCSGHKFDHIVKSHWPWRGRRSSDAPSASLLGGK
jgi:hypothetical protein